MTNTSVSFSSFVLQLPPFATINAKQGVFTIQSIQIKILVNCILQVDSTEWHRWSVQQREAHLKKFRRAAVEIPFKQSVVSKAQEIMNTQ